MVETVAVMMAVVGHASSKRPMYVLMATSVLMPVVVSVSCALPMCQI